MTQPTNLFGAIRSFRGDVDNKVITQQNLSITQDANRPGNRASDSPIYDGDYTYPQFMNVLGFVSGTTGAASTGTAHTHPISVATSIAAGYTHPVNTALGGYIRCTGPYVVDTVAFSTTMATSSAGGSILFQIYRLNADGSFTQIRSDNVKSLVPVGSSAGLISYTLTSPFIVTEGEWYLCRIVNLTSPAVNLITQSLQYGFASTPNTMHKTTTLTLATQTSFTATEANTALTDGTLLPWVVFGQTTTNFPEDRTWWDDFNRIYLGRRWLQNNTAKTGDMTIVNGRLTYTGTTTGLQEAIYLRPTTGDAMRADIDIHAVNANGVVDVFICRDRDNKNGVALAVYQLGALIGTTINGTQTVRATYNGGSNEATWSIYYEPTPDRYTVLKDGASVMTWTDSSHVQPHGANYRFSSVMIECASSQPGGTLDNWVFRDWKP